MAQAYLCATLFPRGLILKPQRDMAPFGWRTLDIVERLEQVLGVPVVHPRTARVWEIQKRLQINEPRQGFGRLISKLPPLRDAI